MLTRDKGAAALSDLGYPFQKQRWRRWQAAAVVLSIAASVSASSTAGLILWTGPRRAVARLSVAVANWMPHDGRINRHCARRAHANLDHAEWPKVARVV